jgi:hypothetical protein
MLSNLRFVWSTTTGLKWTGVRRMVGVVASTNAFSAAAVESEGAWLAVLFLRVIPPPEITVGGWNLKPRRMTTMARALSAKNRILRQTNENQMEQKGLFKACFKKE